MFGLTILLLAVLVVQCVLAYPFSLEPRDVPSDLLARLAYYEQYAAAAYCSANTLDSSTGLLSCSAGNCGSIQAAGATTVLEFSDMGLTDATGYVAIDNSNQAIMVAFRGARSAQNWITSMDFAMDSWSICDNCEAHAGFLQSWLEIRDMILSSIQAALSQYPGYNIVAVGHSLGAAIATLCAADLRTQGYAVSLYSYGSPMVGNQALAGFISQQTTENYRVTHAKDMIPKLPGYFFGYAHVSAEYWITSGNGAPVTTRDVKVCPGTIQFKGNSGTIGSSVDDHMWYFNAVTACS